MDISNHERITCFKVDMLASCIGIALFNLNHSLWFEWSIAHAIYRETRHNNWQRNVRAFNYFKRLMDETLHHYAKGITLETNFPSNPISLNIGRMSNASTRTWNDFKISARWSGPLSTMLKFGVRGVYSKMRRQTFVCWSGARFRPPTVVQKLLLAPKTRIGSTHVM